MEDFSNMINWNNLHRNSQTFKNNKPFRFAFVEEFFVKDFYEKLYQTYPKVDQSWKLSSDMSRFQHFKRAFDNTDTVISTIKLGEENIPNLTAEWKKLLRYSVTDEFVENFRKFSGIDVNKCKYLEFIAYEKGGFQLPHIHNVGPSTLILMIYFSKGWQKGDPGGTYMSSDLDESTILFEPHNLDNTMALFHDSPHAAHGVRYITKDVIRQGIQITLENFSDGVWSGGRDKPVTK